jgi:2-oxoglutarate dehydrogenase E1 component
VVLASGKIAVQAAGERSSRNAPAAVLRVEQLYPWPESRLADLLASYEGAVEVVWLQEEPENMGAAEFVRPRLQRLLGQDFTFRTVARAESSSPATGIAAIHQLEHEDLMARTFGGHS